MNALAAITFLDFTRPYGFDPLMGNTMNFVFMPPEVKALAAIVAIIAFVAARRTITCTTDRRTRDSLALTCAVIAAALVVSIRTDANLMQYYLSADHKYGHLSEDGKMARITRHHGLFMEAKHRMADGYALITSPRDPLMLRIDAQYLLAPIPQRNITDAALIIVTDGSSSYDGKLKTLTTQTAILTNVSQLYAEGEGAIGLYRRQP